eukprot:1502921-Prymnesium_polylepis.1
MFDHVWALATLPLRVCNTGRRLALELSRAIVPSAMPAVREPKNAENAELQRKAGASNFPPLQPIIVRNEQLPSLSWSSHNSSLNSAGDTASVANLAAMANPTYKGLPPYTGAWKDCAYDPELPGPIYHTDQVRVPPTLEHVLRA